MNFIKSVVDSYGAFTQAQFAILSNTATSPEEKAELHAVCSALLAELGFKFTSMLSKLKIAFERLHDKNIKRLVEVNRQLPDMPPQTPEKIAKPEALYKPQLSSERKELLNYSLEALIAISDFIATFGTIYSVGDGATNNKDEVLLAEFLAAKENCQGITEAIGYFDLVSIEIQRAWFMLNPQ